MGHGDWLTEPGGCRRRRPPASATVTVAATETPSLSLLSLPDRDGVPVRLYGLG